MKIIENKIKNYIRQNRSRRVVSIRFPFRNLIPTYIDETMKLYYYDYASKDGKFGDDNYLNLLPAFWKDQNNNNKNYYYLNLIDIIIVYIKANLLRLF